MVASVCEIRDIDGEEEEAGEHMWGRREGNLTQDTLTRPLQLFGFGYNAARSFWVIENVL